MEKVKQAVLDRAVKMLDSLALDYYIALPDGNSISRGNLKMQNRKDKRKARRFPYGTYSKLFDSMGLKTMEVGDVQFVPFGEFTKKELQTGLTGYARNLWGKGSYATCLTKEGVEIMRLS